MKHKHRFAVKVDKNEDVGRNSVYSHGMGGELDGGCDNVYPHMSDEVVGHMVVACLVCVSCVVCAHKVKEYAKSRFRKERDNVVELGPEHNKAGGGANHRSHDGKSETAGFTVEKIKSACDKKEAEEVKKSSHFAPDKIKRSKHKAHANDYRNRAFEFELVFFHNINIPLKNSFVKIPTKVPIHYSI